MNQFQIMLSEKQPQESDIRVGVVVCDCGARIASVIDTEALRRQAAEMPGVVFTSREAYPCTKDGQARLLKAIGDHQLNRVLVAGCSPRLIRSMFRATAQEAGLARSYLNVANIREQCAYIHTQDPSTAFQKAVGLLEMGVARLGVTGAETTRSSEVVKSVLMIGSDISALTTAQDLAEHGIRVTIVERSSGFGEAIPDDLRKATRMQTVEKGHEVSRHPLIDVMFNAHVTEVSGHPGEYAVRVQQNDRIILFSVGVIVVANAAEPKSLGSEHWFDRSRVKTQAEFEAELDEASRQEAPIDLKDVVMIFCADESQRTKCSRTCCNIGIRQALKLKQLNPNANVTILFREIYLGGIGEAYENEMIQSRNLGVTFFRYRKDRPPVIGDQTVDLLDSLTGEALRLPYDRVVMTMPLVPQDNMRQLASLLGLPIDEDGFLAEPRTRLRPGRYAEPGIYALGSAQQPVDTAESLFQAYLTSARVLRFMGQESIKIESPAAQISPSLCTGCGNCPQVCPVKAIQLESRDGVLSLSEIDQLRCIGCGNCVVVCPVKAISLPGWDSVEIPVQMSAALQSGTYRPGAPKIVALACEWSAYAAADIAGARRMTYPADVRIIRTNCSARFDPYHILWAFLNGADGVFLGACPAGECHYGSGNLYALERVEVLKKELREHGYDSRRLHLEFLSVDDGKKFVQTIENFVKKIKELDSEVARR